jgi:hypothetical protein
MSQIESHDEEIEIICVQKTPRAVAIACAGMVMADA